MNLERARASLTPRDVARWLLADGWRLVSETETDQRWRKDREVVLPITSGPAFSASWPELLVELGESDQGHLLHKMMMLRGTVKQVKWQQLEVCNPSSEEPATIIVGVCPWCRGWARHLPTCERGKLEYPRLMGHRFQHGTEEVELLEDNAEVQA